MKPIHKQLILFISATIFLCITSYYFGDEARIFGPRYFLTGLKYDRFLDIMLLFIIIWLWIAIRSLKKMNIKAAINSFWERHKIKFLIPVLIVIISAGSGYADNHARVWSVSLFGAKGDNSTDDTQSIQAAINACNTAGGGVVYFLNGRYIIGGALQASNSQLFIPVVTGTGALRTNITLLGEGQPNMSPNGGGLAIGATTVVPTLGVILKSTLTVGADGAAVIGTASGGSANLTNLYVQNIQIQTKNNPVIGGINYSNGNTLNVDYVTVTIDSAGYNSSLPTHDVAGITGPANSLGQQYSISNCFVAGYRKGYVITEHTFLNNDVAMTCYYALYCKSGYHTNTAIHFGTYWCAYDIYIEGFTTFANFQLDAEWQNIGKWYDDVATVKDSASLAKGNLFYTVTSAGAGVDSTKFSKSGAANLNCLANATPIPGLTIANTFTKLITITSGTNPQLVLNSTANAGQAGVLFDKSAVAKWLLGQDFSANGTADAFLYDYVNSKARLYFGTAGTGGLGGAADAITTAALWFDNSKNVTFNNGDVYVDASNHRLGIGTSTPATNLEIKGANAYSIFNTSSSTTGQGAQFFYSNGTPKWQIGMSFSNNSTRDLYIYDHANSLARLLIGVSGTMNIMGDASTAATSAIAIDNSKNVNFNNGTVYVDATNGRLGVGTAVPGANFEIKGANSYSVLNLSASNGQAAYIFQDRGTGKWQFGMDFVANGTRNFYIYDQANSLARVIISTAGTVFLGGDATSTTASGFNIVTGGTVGLGIAASTGADFLIKAGSTTIAPFRFTSGTNLTTPVVGSMEYDGADLFFTPTGTIRKTVPTVIDARATAQTAANASVATQTVGASDASFMVAANVLVTTSSAEAFTVTCAYTDESNTARTLTMPFVLLAGTTAAAVNFANGAVPYEGVSVMIRCKASTTITIATTGTFTGATYNVEGSIEKIQ